MPELISISTVLIWNSTQPHELQDFNEIQEEIKYYLQKYNYERFIKLLPSVILFIALIAVGVCGNILVFLVYLKQFNVSATRVFVLEMAVCDFLTNIIILPWFIQNIRYSYTSESHLCRMEYFLGTFPVITSYWILVCVALDRRRRICQPLKRQLSPRQATYLLILPLTLSLALMVPSTFWYGVGPVETDRPGITGTTCGFPDKPLELKVKQIFGLVLMAYFLVGFALLTTCYLQISYRIYQQKKRVLAGQINVGVTSCGTKTYLNQGIVSSQEELRTEAFQSKDISTDKSEMGTEEASNQEHLCVDAETLTRTQKTEAFSSTYVLHNLSGKCRSSREDNADGYDTQSFLCQTEVFEYLPNAKVAKADLTETLQLPERSFHKSCTQVCENLSEPVVQHSSTKVTHDSPTAEKSFVSSGHNEKEDHEIKEARLAGSAERTVRSHRKRAHLSKTTLMMLVLTIATVICCVPYIALAVAKVEYVSVHISAWQTNVYFLARVFPFVNSVINPFVYSFCNPKFRLKCRQFLTKRINGQ